MKSIELKKNDTNRTLLNGKYIEKTVFIRNNPLIIEVL